MQNEILNQRILRLLRNNFPLTQAQICLIIGADAKDVKDALTDLMDADRVCLAIDGRRYELASGGYCPDPEPLGAA